MNEKIYDTVIIGGGPAGVAAAVYAARKQLSTVVIAEYFGGKSFVSSGIENWIGEINLSGGELAERLENHTRAQKTIDVKAPDSVLNVRMVDGDLFELKTENGDTVRSRTLIIASGARRRRLGVPGEDTFEGRGVAFCSTCDAPFFRDTVVAVVGSGNAALESGVDLLSYAKKVYMLVRGDDFKGDPVTQEKLLRSPQVELLRNTAIVEIEGEDSVTGLVYKNTKDGTINKLAVDGVFVEIGSMANTEFLDKLVQTNGYGEIVINSKTAETSRPGVFAAGDVTDDPYKQNNIAAGDGVKAALSAYGYLIKTVKRSPCSDCEE